MSYDGIFIYNLIKDLQTINGARINNISLDNNVFHFSLYKKDLKRNLKFNLNPGKGFFYLSESTFVKSKTNNQMVEILNNHLKNAIITNISQYKTDRILVLELFYNDFLLGNIKKNLIFEATGRNTNLILTDESFKIIDAFFKSLTGHDRMIFKGFPYEFPVSNKVSFLLYEDTTKNFSPNIIQQDNFLVSTFLGISSKINTYLVNRKLNLPSFINQPIVPTFNVSTNSFYCYNIFLSTENLLFFDDLSFLLEYIEKIKPLNTLKQQQFIDKQIKKQQSKLTTLNDNLAQALTNIKTYKMLGDLVYAYCLENRYNLSSKPVNDDNVVFFNKLDLTKTYNSNAQEFYKKYHKFKRSIAFIKEQINKTKHLLVYLKEVSTYVEITDAKNIINLNTELKALGFKDIKNQNIKQNKTKKAVPLIKRVDLGDFSIYIGKNSIENAYITFELGTSSDLWVHVKDNFGSHVLIKSKVQKEFPNDIINIACMFAIYYSNIKESAKTPVDVVYRKNLKKLAHSFGSSVTYTKYKTYFVTLDLNIIKNFIKEGS